MQLDIISGGFENKTPVKEAAAVQTGSTTVSNTKKVGKAEKEGQNKDERGDAPFGQEKEPAQSSMEAAMTVLNSQIAKTHCAYSYDAETRRVSIKVFDAETDELIREVPPEKSLEALKKMWEIAGIIVDEKR